MADAGQYALAPADVEPARHRGMTEAVSAATMMDRPLEYMFHPRSVAVVGSISHPSRWWLREYFIDPLTKLGFKGQVYTVDPSGGGDAGSGIYRSLRDIPGPVDQVIACVAARRTLQLLQEARDIGVKVFHVFSAGFAETREPAGIELQQTLADAACQAGIRIIGPNCMGIYCPATGLSFCIDFPSEAGPLGLIGQSGGHTTYIIRLAVERGIRLSKAVSYGNAGDVNECDLLECLAADPDTKIIAMYIEGTRNGPRFLAALSAAASAKPVIVFKGGYTEGGSRATASHTGSMAGSNVVWDGLLRQAGAIRVYSAEEMIDMVVAMLRMKPPSGPITCAVGNGGGSSVMATDECEQVGLRLVPLPPHISERLATFIPMAGSMLRNPVDAGALIVLQRQGYFFGQPADNWEDAVRQCRIGDGDKGWGDFLKAIYQWQGLDLVLFHFSVDINPVPITDWNIGTSSGLMVRAAKMCELPAALVMHLAARESSLRASLRVHEMCLEAGVPLFLSMKGAALAIRRLIDFNRAHPGMLARVQAA
ncbi:MAG: CoA-binding protein [Chloroflexi bacterium]|nr:CoA-binding protein [Chloroflexota bacterium]